MIEIHGGGGGGGGFGGGGAGPGGGNGAGGTYSVFVLCFCAHSILLCPRLVFCNSHLLSCWALLLLIFFLQGVDRMLTVA